LVGDPEELLGDNLELNGEGDCEDGTLEFTYPYGRG